MNPSNATAPILDFGPEQVEGRPPNYEDIVAVIPGAASPGVIFAYWPKIYVPSGAPLPPELVYHEMVHLDRQAGDPREWWRTYLADEAFRYLEELPAHAAEYRYLRGQTNDREKRTRILHRVTLKLIAPLYGYRDVTYSQAKADLLRVPA